nr:hypothetical protein GCM10020093_081960 [Planobispora longispora]
MTRANLTQLGGTGVFVSALRDKLIEGEIDFAVHSLKDLPTTPDPRVVIAAIPPRDDCRDALVAGEAGRPAAGSEDRHGLAAENRPASYAPS